MFLENFTSASDRYVKKDILAIWGPSSRKIKIYIFQDINHFWALIDYFENFFGIFGFKIITSDFRNKIFTKKSILFPWAPTKECPIGLIIFH